MYSSTLVLVYAPFPYSSTDLGSACGSPAGCRMLELTVHAPHMARRPAAAVQLYLSRSREVQLCLLIHLAHVCWVYPGLYYCIQAWCWHGVCGALASPHNLTPGWQSVSENSGGASRPEAPTAMLRAATTAPSTRLAFLVPVREHKAQALLPVLPHTIALQW
jgi:hypothetical protein